jgi:hypothetical protein
MSASKPLIFAPPWFTAMEVTAVPPEAAGSACVTCTSFAFVWYTEKLARRRLSSHELFTPSSKLFDVSIV